MPALVMLANYYENGQISGPSLALSQPAAQIRFTLQPLERKQAVTQHWALLNPGDDYEEHAEMGSSAIWI